MRQSNKRTKKNFVKVPEALKSIFKKRTDLADIDVNAGKPEDINARKWRILQKVLAKAEKTCPELAQKIKNNEVELIGIGERVTYHKMHNDEDMPYTHVFDNPTVLLKCNNSTQLIIFSDHIVYENKFIDG